MVDRRSVSQINFGFLPQQTVDVRGGVWLVEGWTGAHTQAHIDEVALRKELIRSARSWGLSGKDGGFINDLESRRARIIVKSLDRKRGVELKAFPEIWYCKACHKIHRTPDANCCGSTKNKAQLHFVSYCDETAELREPNVPRCNSHNVSRITFPGTATGQEIKFDCPVCNRELQRGFGFSKSSSGNRMKVTVHRAASVFTPRSVVVVNPPSPERMRAIQQAGGSSRALEWILSGMKGRDLSDGEMSADTLRRQLINAGLDEEAINRMIAASGLQNKSYASELGFSSQVQDYVEQQATSIALGFSESRVTIDDLKSKVDALSEIGQRYRVNYPEAIKFAGLSSVELADSFPVLTGHYGYTRGSGDAGASRLMAYRDQRGDYLIYGDIAQTEALYFSLDPLLILKWLNGRGHDLKEAKTERDARISILSAMRSCDEETDPVYKDVVVLVHSFAHRLIRLAAVHAGIDVNALSELLFPAHLSFFVYAAARGDFVLGGLQALFENDLHLLLDAFVTGEHRCALDPGCSSSGGACVACLHLGEPSCRLFNRHLNRASLGGPDGFLTLAQESN